MKALHLASILGGLLLGALIIGTTAQGAPTVPSSGGSGTTYSAARDAGIQVSGSVLSCKSASPNQTGCITNTPQRIKGPKSFEFDAGYVPHVTHYPLYVSKGQDMSSGTQYLGICFVSEPSALDGTTCAAADSRVGYVNLGSDTAMHMKDYLSNDNSGTLSWVGMVTSGTIRASSVIQANGSGVYVEWPTPTAVGALPSCTGNEGTARIIGTTDGGIRICTPGISGWKTITAT